MQCQDQQGFASAGSTQEWEILTRRGKGQARTTPQPPTQSPNGHPWLENQGSWGSGLSLLLPCSMTLSIPTITHDTSLTSLLDP